MCVCPRASELVSECERSGMSGSSSECVILFPRLPLIFLFNSLFFKNIFISTFEKIVNDCVSRSY